MRHLFKRRRASFNVDLRTEFGEDKPYVGCFKVMPDGKLVSGNQRGVRTYQGVVDTESTVPDVEFEGMENRYLVKDNGHYYLREHSVKITQRTIDETVKWAQRGRQTNIC